MSYYRLSIRRARVSGPVKRQCGRIGWSTSVRRAADTSGVGGRCLALHFAQLTAWRAYPRRNFNS